jgi:hypothetical protein
MRRGPTEVRQILTRWTPNLALPFPKPLQATLACNPNYVAAAIRVGAADVAREHVVTRPYDALYDITRVGSLDRRRRHRPPTEADMMRSYLSVAKEPIDEDKNTIFHYASNYEDRDLFEFLMARLGRFYKGALLKENIWGQIPADFSAVCKDPAFKERIDAATEHARNSGRGRHAAKGPASCKAGTHATPTDVWLRQAAEWAEPLLHFADWFRVVRFLLSVRFVGPVLFRHGTVVSLVPFAVLQQSSVAIIAMYAALGLSRKVLRVAYEQGPEMVRLPGWVVVVCVVVAAAAALPCVHHTLLRRIGTIEKVSLLRNVHSRIATTFPPSQLECIELATYCALWWAASNLLVPGMSEAVRPVPAN